ncbi:phenylalanine--tRNA ligase subunit alpha [Candidatus Dependentiae bacterium]|nr:phenylalanine--tRNA ligase subunit alpha [Candidatus Dependentiae bacterium]
MHIKKSIAQANIGTMNDIKKHLETIKQEFLKELAQVTTQQQLEEVRVKYLSRQGVITTLTQQVKELSLEDKRLYGPLFKDIKESTQQAFEQRQENLQALKLSQEAEKLAYFDVTASQPLFSKGSLHPYSQVIQLVQDVVISMGYEVIDGPEVETAYHNFEALNIPENHPARDMQDTFWLTLPGLLMRTHTSSVEVHAMQKRTLPLAVFAPGRTYRNEATDASHDFMFMQAEGLFIDKKVSLSHLFATVKTFLQALFETKDLSIRIRPSYFPFVEPGVEIDMSCPFCTQGCSICKKTRWIEICGAGLTHPHVLKACNINPNEYSGFAFGFGLTRLVMLKYGITDIRLLHTNRIEFLKQF